MSGSRRSSTTQSHGCSRMSVDSASAPVPAVTISMSSWPSSSAMLICSAVLSSTTSSRLRRGLAYSLMRVRARLRRPRGVVGLVTNENAPRAKPVLAILVERDDLHRNVPGQRVLLELAQHGPAQHVGQEHVERHRGRLVLLGEIERVGAAHRDQHLEALVARQVDQDARIVRIVLDDQQDRIAGLRSRAGRRGSARRRAPAVRPRAGSGHAPLAWRRPPPSAAARSARHICSGR